MQLVVYFCGTGNDGRDFMPTFDRLRPAEDVKVIFVQGCDHPEVCDNPMNPDLADYAARFSRDMLTHDGNNQLRLATGQAHRARLGILSPVDLIKRSIHELSPAEYEPLLAELAANPNDENFQALEDKFRETNPDFTLKDIKGRLFDMIRLTSLNDAVGRPIDNIILAGYSRGAVTTFEVAKSLQSMQLKRNAPLTPVSIFAQEPVPGNLTELPGTNAYSAGNCSRLHNITDATLVIAAYTGEVVSYNGQNEALRSGLHKLAFRQVIPEFGPFTETSLIATPRPHHWSGIFAGEHYLVEGVTRSVYEHAPHNKAMLEQAHIATAAKNALYEQRTAWLAFPEPHQIQGCYGYDISRFLPAYADKAHPAPYLTRRFDWRVDPYATESSETMLACWQRQDALLKAGRVSDHTRTLTELLSETSSLVQTRIRDLARLVRGPLPRLGSEGYSFDEEIAAMAAARDRVRQATDAMHRLYDATGAWLSDNAPDQKRRPLVESLRGALYYQLYQLNQAPLVAPSVSIETTGDSVLTRERTLFNLPKEQPQPPRPSRSLFHFFGGGSLASIDDFEFDHSDALYRALHNTISAMQEAARQQGVSMKSWNDHFRAFSPSAHVLHEAIEKKGRSALGEAHQLLYFQEYVKNYMSTPVAPIRLPHRDQRVVEMEQNFKEAFAKQLRRVGLESYLPVMPTGPSSPSSSSSSMADDDRDHGDTEALRPRR